DHAMVVSAAGGSCVCVRCGVACTGRFAGCTEILAEPGRVPAFAPAWALDAEATPPAPVAVGPARIRSGAVDQPSNTKVTTNGARPDTSASNGHVPVEG